MLGWAHSATQLAVASLDRRVGLNEPVKVLEPNDDPSIAAVAESGAFDYRLV